MKETTTSSSLGITNNTLGVSKGRKRWKEYISRALVLLKNSKIETSKSNVITMAAVLRKKDLRNG